MGELLLSRWGELGKLDSFKQCFHHAGVSLFFPQVERKTIECNPALYKGRNGGNGRVSLRADQAGRMDNIVDLNMHRGETERKGFP